jgi:hypothetical protein
MSSLFYTPAVSVLPLGESATFALSPMTSGRLLATAKLDSYPPQLEPRHLWYAHLQCMYHGRQTDQEYFQEHVFSVFFPRLKPGADTMQTMLTGKPNAPLTSQDPRVEGLFDYFTGRLFPYGTWHAKPVANYFWHYERGRKINDAMPEFLR